MAASDQSVVAPLPVLAGEFDWDNLPAGEWVRLPTTGEAGPKVFHGGATIAPERGLVFFFGSDTHWPTPLEKGETNAVWRLNLKTLAWSQDYEQDPKSSYRILDNNGASVSVFPGHGNAHSES